MRSEFDVMMLNNAREHGVAVHEATACSTCCSMANGPSACKVQIDGGQVHEVRARVVVDASGQSTMLQNRFKLRRWDPLLNKGAVWTYWKGAYRDTGRDEGATLVIQTPNKQGWFWYIPLHNDIVSVGVVAPFDYLFKGRGSHEQVYNRGSRCLSRRQGADRDGQANGRLLRHQGLFLSLQGWPETAGC